jgi:hypothetical protein
MCFCLGEKMAQKRAREEDPDYNFRLSTWSRAQDEEKIVEDFRAKLRKSMENLSEYKEGFGFLSYNVGFSPSSDQMVTKGFCHLPVLDHGGPDFTKCDICVDHPGIFVNDKCAECDGKEFIELEPLPSAVLVRLGQKDPLPMPVDIGYPRGTQFVSYLHQVSVLLNVDVEELETDWYEHELLINGKEWGCDWNNLEAEEIVECGKLFENFEFRVSEYTICRKSKAGKEYPDLKTWVLHVECVRK